MRTWIKLTGIFLVGVLVYSCSNKDESFYTEDSNLQLKSAQITLSAEGKYIVVFKDNVTNPGAQAETMRGSYGFTKGHVFDRILKGFSAVIPAQALEAMRKNPNVAYIEPDLIMTACGQTIPTGISRIGATLQSIVPIDGVADTPNVDVAVVDTGVDGTHPDLNVSTTGVRFYNAGSTDTNFADDNGHGTHVSGTIAAIDNGIGVVGVCPGAKIWAVKVLDSSGSGYISDIIAGLNWVVTQGNIEVVNMSLGGTGSSTAFRTAIQNCVANGIVVVVAAGNSAKDIYGSDGKYGTSDDFVPASYPEVICVSAMADSDGKPGGLGSSTSYGSDDSFASFSNYSKSVTSEKNVTSPGKAIDLLLPGVNIYSTYKGQSYATMSGTSMATPHGTGLAALYILKYGRATNAAGVYAIRQALINLGKAQTDASYGLAKQNDPDGYKENIGWAVFSTGPVAAFSYSASGLAVTFTDASTDLSGSITNWSWNFGDSGTSAAQSPSHTYSTAGTYTVSLTVTDNNSATNSTSKSVTVSASSGIVLTATGVKSGNTYKVTLTWTGGTSPYKVYRNGSQIASKINAKTYTDNLTRRGTYTYKIIDNASVSSNTVSITY